MSEYCHGFITETWCTADDGQSYRRGLPLDKISCRLSETIAGSLVECFGVCYLYYSCTEESCDVEWLLWLPSSALMLQAHNLVS